MKILLYPSALEEETRRVQEVLSRLDGLEVVLVPEARLIRGLVLPFIEIEGGERFFGVNAVERFVELQSTAA